MAKEFVITLERFRRGWGKSLRYAGQETQASYEMLNEQYSERSRAISLWRAGMAGYVAPGETFTALSDGSTRVNALPLNGIIRSTDSEQFAILANARVVQWGTDDIVDAHNATAHGGHSSLVGEDIVNYRDVSDEYTFYSFYDATDADVGRLPQSTGTYDDDFLSTLANQQNGSTLTKNVPLKLIIVRDIASRTLYITNGRYIASHQLGSNTVNYQAFDLGVGMIAQDFEYDNGRLAIVASRDATFPGFIAGESTLYLWDFVKPNALTEPIDDSFVSSVKKTVNGLMIFTFGKNNTTKVKRFLGIGAGFETIFESAQVGKPPLKGSMEWFENMLHFAGVVNSSSASMDAIGKIFCLDGNAFHYRMFVTDGSFTPSDTGGRSTGMVKNLNSNSLYVGQYVGTGYKIFNINRGGYYTASQFRTPLIDTPYRSNLEKFRFKFAQFGSGASFRPYIAKDFNTMNFGSSESNDLLGVGSITSLSHTLAHTIRQTIPDVNSFYMDLKMDHASVGNTAAIIRKIQIIGVETDDKT